MEFAINRTSLIAVCAGAALQLGANAQMSPAPSDPSDLRALAAAYEPFTSASVEFTADSGSTEGGHVIRLTASSDRRFAYEEFVQDRALSRDRWSSEPYYFVFFDSHTLFVNRSPGTIYEQSIPEASYTQGFGATQFTLVPWPMMHTWCLALADDPRTEYHKQADRWTASNSTLGIRLAWNSNHALLAVTKLLAPNGSTQSVEFSDFDTRSPLSLPRRAIQSTHIVRSEKAQDTSAQYSVRVRLNPADAESTIAFNPVPRGLKRLDPATSNVFAPDGTLLFNLKKREREVDAAWNGVSQYQWLMFLGLGTAIALSCFIAVRMARSRHRARQH